MKTSLLRSALALIALAAALSSSAADSASRQPIPGGQVQLTRVQARFNANGDTVAAGDGRIMVQLRLGQPTKVLRDGTWFYSRYQGDDSAGRNFAGNLLIRFHQGKVASMLLADNATVTALIELHRQPVAKKNHLAATR